mmetsp:Transcript_41268/g.103031  ORF Transcript_41268/g.103031 Transcript_41268/m.103031 type:complete len:201 (-) Transcript_41268:408-1010(-)
MFFSWFNTLPGSNALTTNKSCSSLSVSYLSARSSHPWHLLGICGSITSPVHILLKPRPSARAKMVIVGIDAPAGKRPQGVESDVAPATPSPHSTRHPAAEHGVAGTHQIAVRTEIPGSAHAEWWVSEVAVGPPWGKPLVAQGVAHGGRLGRGRRMRCRRSGLGLTCCCCSGAETVNNGAAKGRLDCFEVLEGINERTVGI